MVVAPIRRDSHSTLNLVAVYVDTVVCPGEIFCKGARREQLAKILAD